MKQRLEPGKKKRIVGSHSVHPCSVHMKQPADRNHPPPSTPPHSQTPRTPARTFTHRRELQVLIASRALRGARLLSRHANKHKRPPPSSRGTRCTSTAHPSLFLSLHLPPSLHHCSEFGTTQGEVCLFFTSSGIKQQRLSDDVADGQSLRRQKHGQRVLDLQLASGTS